MKRITSGPVIIAALIALLMVALFWRSNKVDTLNIQHSNVIEIFRELSRLEETYDKALLESRFNLYHNFDILLNSHTRISDLAEQLTEAELSTYNSGIASFDYHLDRFRLAHELKGDLTSHLIRDLSLYKNSLAYYAVTSSEYGGNLYIDRAFSEHGNDAHNANSFLHMLHRLQRDVLVYSNSQGDANRKAIERHFVTVRNELPKLPAELQTGVVRLLKHGNIVLENKGDVERLMGEIQGLPTTDYLQEMVSAYLNYHDKEEDTARFLRYVLFAIVALMLLVLVYTLVRLRETAESLLLEKELAQVTLGSIGDAVITVDEKANVQYINSVGEILTGWGFSEIRHLPLASLLDIDNLITNDSVLSSILNAARSGDPLKITSQTVLTNRHKDRYFVTVTVSPIKNEYGENSGAVIAFRDITDNRSLSERLSHQHEHDSLTDLINRHTFEERVNQIIDAQKSTGFRRRVLCYIGLDSFNVINANCGYSGGDELLRLIAKVIRTSTKTTDIAARMGSDEFAVLVAIDNMSDGLEVAYKLREAINNAQFTYEGHSYHIDASIGVVYLSADTRHFGEMLLSAQQALKAAKSRGNNQVYFYDKSDSTVRGLRDELELVPRINDALTNNRFVLYLQPIEHTVGGDNSHHHAEVLLRMLDEKGQMHSPVAFVPVAEHFGIMSKIDAWVVNEVFRRFAELEKSDPDPERRFAINLSAMTVGNEYFLRAIKEAMENYQIDSSRISFEITETAAFSNMQAAIHFIQKLKDLGFEFAIDDFGRGIASYASLKMLPVDYLKIDGSLIKDLCENRVNEAIVESIYHVARAMGLAVIAEYVEDDDIREKLRWIGVEFVQGFGVARPAEWKMSE